VNRRPGRLSPLTTLARGLACLEHPVELSRKWTGGFKNTLHTPERVLSFGETAAVLRQSTQMRSQQVQHLEYDHAYDERGDE